MCVFHITLFIHAMQTESPVKNIQLLPAGIKETAYKISTFTFIYKTEVDDLEG